MDVTIFLTAQIAVMALSLLLALVILVHGRRLAAADGPFRLHRHEVRLLTGWATLLTASIVPFTTVFTPPHVFKNILWLAALLWTACGYSDLPTFTRAFKRQFGMAPSEYRKQGKDA